MPVITKAQSNSPQVKFVGSDMIVPINGYFVAQMELLDGSNLTGFNLRLTYETHQIKIKSVDVRPGQSFQGLTRQHDYLMQVTEQQNPTTNQTELLISMRLLDTESALLDGVLLEILGQTQASVTNSQMSIVADKLELLDTNGAIYLSQPDTIQINAIEIPAPHELYVRLPAEKSVAMRTTQAGYHYLAFKNGSTQIIASNEGLIRIPTDNRNGSVIISRPGYLATEQSAEQITTQTEVLTLRAGDVNGDGQVNIFDLSLMASHFGESVASIDPNPLLEKMNYVETGVSANRINVQDLVVAAQHYGMSSK
ncbi:hypothetical protein QUF63_15875 [Anaerolineales bacterium HSG25]|nr:hypothetical protein [Anaerolineales bacterium HSG25]